MSEQTDNSKRSVLAVGAHPDDIELGCGGTIYKHLQQKDDIYCLIMTHGEQGGHHTEQRECLASLTFLGVPRDHIFFGNCLDGYLPHNQKTTSEIEEYIKRFKVDTVYGHSRNDRHQDHYNLSRATSAAARHVPNILLYEGPSKEPTFEPHYFEVLNENQIKMKLDALKCYDTQIKKGIVNLKTLEAQAVMWGGAIKKPFAEAFEVNHIVRDSKGV